MLSGVSGGLAGYFDVDPVLVRLLWVAGAVLSGGALLLAYLALWILVPEEPDRPWLTPHTEDPRPPVPTGEAAPDGEPPGSGGESEASEPPVGTDRWATDTSYEAADAGNSSARRRNGAAILLITLGLLFLANNVGLFRWFNWSVYWPVVLIAVGAALLLNRARR
jgi:phage shock protein PspC (stress-responsive transcriptional regulator)